MREHTATICLGIPAAAAATLLSDSASFCILQQNMGIYLTEIYGIGAVSSHGWEWNGVQMDLFCGQHLTFLHREKQDLTLHLKCCKDPRHNGVTLIFQNITSKCWFFGLYFHLSAFKTLGRPECGPSHKLSCFPTLRTQTMRNWCVWLHWWRRESPLIWLYNGLMKCIALSEMKNK